MLLVHGVGHKCRETIKKYDHSKKLKLLELAMVKNKKGLLVYNYLKTLLFMARLAGVEPAAYGFVARTFEFSNLLNLRKLLENQFFILADFSIFHVLAHFGEKVPQKVPHKITYNSDKFPTEFSPSQSNH